MKPFQEPSHTHKQCVDNAQERFEKTISSLSRPVGAHVHEVFEVLLQHHKAFGAYEIADFLAKKGKRLQATQIYRALDRLIELGNVHRIEATNAYIACHRGDECKRPQLLICKSCDQVAEINSKPIENSIDKTARETGFVLQDRQVELFGLCPSCAV